MNTELTTAVPAPDTAEGARRPGLPWWLAGGLGVAAATAANLAIFALGHLTSASYLHPDGGEIVPVTVGDVVVSSAVPLAVGFLAAVALSLLWTGFLRVGQVVGTVLALLSVAGPLIIDTDTATRVLLALMHVVLAPAVWFSLGAVRRRVLS